MQGSYLSIDSRPGDGRSVLLAMSGGVDSAVSALALVEAGYRVVGVTMKNYCYGDSATIPERSCCSTDAIDDARGVCQRIGIRHLVVSTEEMFGRQVYDDFLAEYARGRTPNPCVRCNSIVRFDTLVNWAEQMDFEFVATGHYARVFRSHAGRHYVARAAHAAKDQAYFLSAVNPAILDRVLFPLGDREKPSVRGHARDAGLSIAEKPDSQEVCFVSTRSLREFLDGRVPLAAGPIENTRGEVIGEHDGVAAFTVGQRRGLGVSAAKPQYVVALDAERNAVVLGDEENLLRCELECSLAWIDADAVADPSALTAQIRSRHPAEAIAGLSVRGSRARVTFANAQRAVAPGQTIAFFDGDVVVGAGVIEAAGVR
ncbi:MAG: tRNA 2-thiouridine(34) synthase MnmA [Candidatus Krumholzibacteria bacterium]|nr:tRNA 2-thiouridine(34) synthase MnmA [Candidatus Krumholzibacteria bacterium]MDH4335893.1 tRNA 2-thiouridine(34) synthase MnmA [Candidatus Krumholzibacteria bacterium]MDH5268531.1 tRNA 2-thiouridine(34) synthase MnmA [Candidatus Krumholzibacteria bacterium]MDH5628062.1 tRNA 2-thiouridine(34) synthase MnmA [Candidatus Krumholzibacteria bacterium]